MPHAPNDTRATAAATRAIISCAVISGRQLLIVAGLLHSDLMRSSKSYRNTLSHTHTQLIGYKMQLFVCFYCKFVNSTKQNTNKEAKEAARRRVEHMAGVAASCQGDRSRDRGCAACWLSQCLEACHQY